MPRAKAFRDTRARGRNPFTQHVADVLERRVLLATTPITVFNPSFEEFETSDNEQTSVVSWQDVEVGRAFNPTNVDYTNADDDGPTNGVLPAPGDQKQVLFIPSFFTFTTVFQLLSTTVTGGDTQYSLTVAVGNSGVEDVGDIEIALFAGDI